jgi:hypothetical protein
MVMVGTWRGRSLAGLIDFMSEENSKAVNGVLKDGIKNSMPI